MGEQGLKEGGRAGQHADPMPFDQAQRALRVEGRLGIDGRPAQERGEPARLVAEGMEEGVDDQIAILPVQPHGGSPFLESGDVLPVGDHGPLGRSGGAGAVHDVGELFGPHCGDASGQGGVVQFAAGAGEGFQGLQRFRGLAIKRGLPRAPQNQDSLQGGAVLGGKQGSIVAAQEIADGEGQLGPGAAGDVGRLRPFESGVDGYQNAADLLAGQRGDNPLRHVRRPDQEALARGEAGGEQRLGQPVGAGFEVGEGQPQLPIDNGRPVRKGRGRRLQRPGNRPLQVELHARLNLLNAQFFPPKSAQIEKKA